ncbi:MAG: hypothetical protein Q8J99_17385, partial [Sulfuritalea sp.]|nr:hypothetical protein [Sulfuritalea sp.]
MSPAPGWCAADERLESAGVQLKHVTMTFHDRMQLIPHRLWLTVAMFVLLAGAFGAYVYSERQLDVAGELRHRSFLLANQLRQSSDDLTRMARTYVATGDPRYKVYYQDILKIRDGRKPRPPGYFGGYWDLLLADPGAPRPQGGHAVPLLELMREAEFPESELRKLAEAKADSDRLTAIEFEAMKLVESAVSDGDRPRALRMLHDADYHRGKAAIMGPINEVYAAMDRRTAT